MPSEKNGASTEADPTEAVGSRALGTLGSKAALIPTKLCNPAGGSGPPGCPPGDGTCWGLPAELSWVRLAGDKRRGCPLTGPLKAFLSH